MPKLISCLVLALVLSLGLSSAHAADEKLSPAQVKEIKKLIKETLMENPEMIADAIQALDEKQRLESEKETKKAMKERLKDIYEDPNTPVGGNPKGDVTLVEFFDYRCGYCKGVHEALMRVVKEDGKVKLVYKEFPILGAESVYASKAALASVKQKKYPEFQDALMRHKGSYSEEAVAAIAKEVGLDAAQLKKDMNSDDITKQMKANFELAENLGIRGTPAFMMGDRVVPGAVPEASLRQWLADARTKKMK